MMGSSRFLLLFGLALPAMSVHAQTAGAAQGSLTSINGGTVSAVGVNTTSRIDGGEFNSMSVSAAGALSSVKNSEIVSIAPDPAAGADGNTLAANMIVGTSSTTSNSGTVQAQGSFVGAVNFGNRNSMSISATGAGTTYSISTSSAPGGGASNSSGSSK